jgi:hypothetical protein
MGRPAHHKLLPFFGVVDAEAAKDLFSSSALNDKVGAIVCYSIITISMPSCRAFLICPKL